MKKIMLSLLILVPALTWAQEKKFELGVAVGNNGMFKEVQEDMYEYVFDLFDYEIYEIKSSELKYTLSARYFFSENVSGRLRFGYAKLKDDFEGSVSGFNTDKVEIIQNVTNITPAVCFSKQLDMFEIMTTLELPLIFVGDIEAETDIDYPMAPLYVSSKETISGGFIWGFSSGIGVKYNFSKLIAIGSEINFGLLFANVGDEIEKEVDYGSGPDTASKEGEFKKTYFSSPEISLGLYFRMGGGKAATTDSK